MMAQHCLKSWEESAITIDRSPPPMSEVLIWETWMEIPQQEPTTSQEPNQLTHKSMPAARQRRMDNMPEEKATADELDFAGRDMPNLLKCKLNENTNVCTALKLALKDITPTHQTDANANPLPALIPLRDPKGRQGFSLTGPKHLPESSREQS